MELTPEAWKHPFFDVLPGRWREEIQATGPDGVITRSVRAHDEGSFWSDDSQGAKATSGRTVQTSLMCGWVVGTRWTTEPAQLEVLGGLSMLGRWGVQVRMVLRAEAGRSVAFRYGDSRELLVDSATGMTLTVTDVLDAEPFRHREVVTIEPDAEFAADLTAVLEGAERVTPSPSRKRIEEPRDMAAAAALVVLSPSWLPPGYVFETGSPRADDGSDAPRASLFFSRDRRDFVTIREVPDAEPLRQVYEWERVERGTRTVLITDRSDASGTRVAETALAGTRAIIRAPLPADDLLELAFSLEVVHA